MLEQAACEGYTISTTSHSEFLHPHRIWRISLQQRVSKYEGDFLALIARLFKFRF